MEFISEDELVSSLERVVLQPLCSQGWPGYGNVLFLSFGRKVFPPIVPGIGLAKQKQPGHQLRTNMSYWWVQNELLVGQKGKDLGQSELGRESALAAIAALIGQKGLGVEVFDGFAIKIQFSNNLSLCIKPYQSNVDATSSIWGVRGTDGFVSLVTHSGLMYRVHKNEPSSNYLDALREKVREMED